MAFDNTVTVTGNCVRDPELRFSAGGMAIVSLGIAWNKRKKDGEDQVSFFDVTAFGQMAENVAESIRKGDRITVYGALEQRSWEGKEGEKRSKVSIIADEISPSLRWATASPSRNDRKEGNAPSSAPKKDWQTYEDEPF